MVIWTLAKKDLRLLLRDARAMMILLAMPLIFILVLGVSLGEGFGKPAEDRLRVSVLILDEGVPRQFDLPAMTREGFGWFAIQPALLAGPTEVCVGASLARASHSAWFPHESWSELVVRDLRKTANIRVELVESRAQADDLVRTGRRAAVLVLGRRFSKRVERCSFLAAGWRESFEMALATTQPGDPICMALGGLLQETQTAYPLYLLDGLNPFYRDGVNLAALDAEVLRDPAQQTASAIIDQVAQGSLLRVVMPWMIGRAFERIGDPTFLGVLGHEEQLPGLVKMFLTSKSIPVSQKRQLSTGLQNALQNIFPRYNLTAKTWAALTKEHENPAAGAGMAAYAEEGQGMLKRGAMRYQALVPSYLVMFAFFMVLTVGWLFVAERRQGTMKRLAAAPLARWQILTGKLLPCLVLSLFQGFFILGAGRLIFGMSWGADPLWLVPLVAATSLAAMGLAMLVAAVARTETQVAIYGTLLVLVLAGLSGCLMGDRALMPEQMQQLSRITPHAWALDAYKQLLTVPTPNLALVAQACGVLAGFGLGFLALAWGLLRVEA
jgi:ABC-2 type transport system permease protein